MGDIDKELEKAVELRKEKKLDEAQSALNELLNSAGKDSRVWMQLGHVFVAKNEYAQGVEAFREATLLTPKDYKPWLSLGYALKENKDLKGAIEATEKAKDLIDPESKTINYAHYNLACYHSLNGNSETALNYLEQCLKGDASIKEWAKTDNDLDPIRSEQRFNDLIQ
jgi:Flp pilus assembly protein TadD